MCKLYSFFIHQVGTNQYALEDMHLVISTEQLIQLFKELGNSNWFLVNAFFRLFKNFLVPSICNVLNLLCFLVLFLVID